MHELDPDRLLPSDPAVRGLAREIVASTAGLPIVSPHGHLPAALFADDAPFTDPAALLLTGDHYVTRMLHSLGVEPRRVGVRPLAGGDVASAREAWRVLAEHWYAFRGTPSRYWIEHALHQVLGVTGCFGTSSADDLFDEVAERLADPRCLPRALHDRMDIDWLSTTDAALDTLEAHAGLADSGWSGRVVPTFRPDDVTDPDLPGFVDRVEDLGALTGCDTRTWAGYLDALSLRREHFLRQGATATDHGHPTPLTLDLERTEAARLYARVRTGTADAAQREAFRGQLLTEMARMSVEDGLVMQLHAGSLRNHDPTMHRDYGTDRGADIPTAVDFVRSLQPLLARFGTARRLTLVVFTLDESTYSRELAPLAGYYPALRLGPPWWFHDSPHGMRRHRAATVETAGFWNTAGFNDDARCLPTIQGRHDMARRLDASFLAELVAEHQLTLEEAVSTAVALADSLPRQTYRVPERVVSEP